MNWFRIEVDKGKDETYHLVGSSELAPEELAERASLGQFIRLENLLYIDRGDVKSWDEWDRSLIPAVIINPRSIVSIMQFKGDPRSTPRK